MINSLSIALCRMTSKVYQSRLAVFIILMGLFGSIFIPFNYANATSSDSITINNQTKILIVYYSRSGNTGQVAQHIHDQIGGDIVRLETVNPYPEQYRATTIQARLELDEDARPDLKTKINNIADYDVIFIGSPNWWGTMSMPVRSFLYEYDLSGKVLIPFISHEGSGLGRSVDDLKKFEPNATILEGLAIRGGSAANSLPQVQQWLKQIGILK